MFANYVSVTLFLCCAVAYLHNSDAWFLRRANLRRYFGVGPKIIVGDPIKMPLADETMMRHVRTSAEQKIKEYNLKQKFKANQELYDLDSGKETRIHTHHRDRDHHDHDHRDHHDHEESGSDSSITIGLPFPFMRSKSNLRIKMIKEKDNDSEYAYSTINEKYKDFKYKDSDFDSVRHLPEMSYPTQATPDVMKMVNIDLIGGGIKDSESFVKFFKMPPKEQDWQEKPKNRKRPTAFILQWNLPMMFRKHK